MLNFRITVLLTVVSVYFATLTQWPIAKALHCNHALSKRLWKFAYTIHNDDGEKFRFQLGALQVDIPDFEIKYLGYDRL